MRVLVVEDNEQLADLLQRGLRKEGFTVDSVDNMDDAIAALTIASYDTIVLDRGLPDGDGLGLIGVLRERELTTPILVLSARDRLDDRLCGLRAGADDYLTKPFSFEELVLRLQALLRRPKAVVSTRVTVANLSLDPETLVANVDGLPLDIGRRERMLLRKLMLAEGRIISREALDEALFGFNEEVNPNTIDVCLHRLRRSLERANAKVVIKTVRGIGLSLRAAQ